MGWFRRRKQAPPPPQWPEMPDVIRPGDPFWAMFEQALETGQVVTATVDEDGTVHVDGEDD